MGLVSSSYPDVRQGVFYTNVIFFLLMMRAELEPKFIETPNFLKALLYVAYYCTTRGRSRWPLGCGEARLT